MITVVSLDAQGSQFEDRFSPFADATNQMIDFSAEAARRERPKRAYSNVIALPQAVAAAAQSGRPRHFHLLADDELEQLRPLIAALVSRREEVARHARRQYALHFGGLGALSDADFTRLFLPALERADAALLNGGIDEYAAKIANLSRVLAQCDVPLAEAIAALQLVVTSVRETLETEPAWPRRLDLIFDKLIQVRVIALVVAYFEACSIQLGAAVAPAQPPPVEISRFHGLIGASPIMRRLYQRIEAAGATRGNLLIVGASGVGKELVARAIHECGRRGERPFVALNCAALPKDLIESELFGYKKGAFSGATNEYPGLFRAAEGGTLLLDEITEMSVDTQSKLLRAIQERAIRPVGATREQPVNVRMISSTNREPKAAVADGHLREDLYYRLQACVLAVPALRERREDIPLLAAHFVATFNEELGRNVEGVEQRALEAMSRHEWPGNVRELANTIEGAMTFGQDALIRLEDLPAAATASYCGPHQALPNLAEPAMPIATASVATFADTERDLIARALSVVDGNKVHAARRLNISRKKLYAKIAKYGLSCEPSSATLRKPKVI
jgi:two-component system response regulator AtoC